MTNPHMKDMINEAVTTFAERVVAIEHYFQTQVTGAKASFQHTDGRIFKVIITVKDPDQEGSKDVH